MYSEYSWLLPPDEVHSRQAKKLGQISPQIGIIGILYSDGFYSQKRKAPNTVTFGLWHTPHASTWLVTIYNNPNLHDLNPDHIQLSKC